MDLGGKVINSLEEFQGDHVQIYLLIMRCFCNPKESVVYNMAKDMKDKFGGDYSYEQMMRQLQVKEDEKWKKGGYSCALCSEKILFEPSGFLL